MALLQKAKVTENVLLLVAPAKTFDQAEKREPNCRRMLQQQPNLDRCCCNGRDLVAGEEEEEEEEGEADVQVEKHPEEGGGSGGVKVKKEMQPEDEDSKDGDKDSKDGAKDEGATAAPQDKLVHGSYMLL